MAKYTKAQQDYIDGAKETSTGLDKLVYVNPDDCAPVLKDYGIDYFAEKTPFTLADAIKDKTSDMPPEQLKEFYAKLSTSLAQDINGQLLGAGDQLFNKIDNAEELEHRKELIDSILTKGTSSIDHQTLGNIKFGVAVLPTPQLDTREEMIRNHNNSYPPNIVQALIKNLTAINIKGVGKHEGGHLDNEPSEKSPLGRITDEYKADSTQLASDDAETVRQWRAYRALSPSNADYATSASILSGAPISKLHVEIAETLEDTMYTDVENGFDPNSYNGTAKTYGEMLHKDPDVFFKALNKSLDQKIEEATQAYKDNPDSPEAIEGAVKTQIYADYAHCFEDAYKRYALGQNHPDIKPLQIIPEGKLAQAYEDIKMKDGIEQLAEKSLESTLEKTNPLNDYNLINGENVTDPMELEGEELKQFLEMEADSLKQLHSFITTLKDDPNNLEVAISYDQAFEHYLIQHNNMADVTGNHDQMLVLDPVISREDKHDFFKKQYEQEHGLSKPKLGDDAQSSKVSVDHENRVVLFDGKPITEHFAQNADPNLAPATPTSDVDIASVDANGQTAVAPGTSTSAFS